MKNSIFTSLLLLFAMGTLLAQTALPQGMNYQAVARDADGQVMANQAITLKIRLLAGPAQERAVYAEMHEITTNQIGLFNLIIGEGQTSKGAFAEVPWSSEEIWLDIAIDEGGHSDFTSISTTRLLAVPYAFHAGSAEKVIGDQPEIEGAEKITGPYWKTNGNAGVLAPFQFLGTVDANPLLFKTNNQTRMTIEATGDISMNNNLRVMGTVMADAFVGDGSGLTGINVNDADSDPTNELQNWSNLPGIPADIADGDQVNDADADPTNELELPANAQLGDIAFFNGVSWQPIPSGMDGQVLTLSGGVPTWATSGGGGGGGGGNLGSLLPVILPDGNTIYAHPTDNVGESPGIIWGESGTDIPGLPNIIANNPDVNVDFNGPANTQAILNALGTFNGGAYAANFCNNLVAFGFDDWYLPAAGELYTMYQQLGSNTNGFGGSGAMPNGTYWSSSEISDISAWRQSFNTGLIFSGNKEGIPRCRCVRR